MYNFVSTVQKPTTVTHSVTGYFTSSKEKNLIISKCTKIEIYSMTADGLHPILDVNIYGQISSLELFRVNGEKQDYLFISTERYKYCVLAYDSIKKEIVTKLSGNSEDTTGRPSGSGQIGKVDPKSQVIALHLYEGLLKLIPLKNNTNSNNNNNNNNNNNSGLDAYNIKLEELQIINICFLYKQDQPTIAVLYQDTSKSRHLNTYQLKINDKDKHIGPWSQSDVEIGSRLMIPVPFGGLVLVGEQVIVYMNGKHPIVTCTIPFTCMVAWERVDEDGSRYLLGDSSGRLFVLVLVVDHNQNPPLVREMTIETLGETSVASSISYLDNGITYIGSSQGDSQLIQLSTEKDQETDSYLSVLESFVNLGPIQDFCVVDLEKQGQGQIVTCSGINKDGSLRVVRNGIGIAEQASIELPGIKGIWSLKVANEQQSATFDQFLVVSFIGSTKVLKFEGEEIEEIEIKGFDQASETIYCGNWNKFYIQITRTGVYVIDSRFRRVSQYTNRGNKMNNLSARFSNQILLAFGNQLCYIELELDNDGGCQIQVRKQISMPYEISCLDLSTFEGQDKSILCAVGLWTDITIRILTLPDLEEVRNESLGGEIIPRSVLLLTMEGIHYLLCSLGDGHLFNFTLNINNYTLHDRKKLSLGTQPILLTRFQMKNSINIFAASDRPTVIYSKSKKLFYSIVNLKEVTQVCSFNSSNFQNCLAISNEQTLTIGTIDQIQKLHIKTIPLNEMPRRIAYVEEYSCYAVVTVNEYNNLNTNTNNNNDNFNNINTYFIKLLNDQTFEVTSSYQLDNKEIAWCITTVKFTGDPSTYIAVGTSYPERLGPNKEPTSGRIMLFQINNSKLILMEEQLTLSMVYYLLPFQGKLLACIGKRLHLIQWKYNDQEEDGKLLGSKCVYKGHTHITQIAARGDFVVVADLIKSMSLLSYKPSDNSFQEIGRNPQPLWLKTIAIIDDDHFIGAETSNNFLVVKKNSESTNEQERELLDSVGHFHVGETTNWMKHGSLVTLSEQDQATRKIPTILFVTINGSIGVVASLTKDEYDFFYKLQEGLNRVIQGVGGFSHSDWRSFSNEHNVIPANNFIDGDLVEMFLDLDHGTMLKVVSGLNITTDDAYKRIEALMQHIR